MNSYGAYVLVNRLNVATKGQCKTNQTRLRLNKVGCGEENFSPPWVLIYHLYPAEDPFAVDTKL